MADMEFHDEQRDQNEQTINHDDHGAATPEYSQENKDNAEHAQEVFEEQKAGEVKESQPEIVASASSSEDAGKVAAMDPQADERIVHPKQEDKDGELKEPVSQKVSLNRDADLHSRPKLMRATAEAHIAADPNDPAINNQGENTTHANRPGNSTAASFPRQAPPTTTAVMRGEVPAEDGKFHQTVQG